MSRIDKPDLMVDGPKDEPSKSGPFITKLGSWGLFEPFTKYGLLGCCIGFICLLQWYTQHETTKTMAWAFAQVQAEQDAARAAQEAASQERQRNWLEIRANTKAMEQVIAELHAARADLASARKGQDEIRTQMKAVEKAVKEMP